MHALNFTTHRSQLGETLGGIHFSCSVSTTLEQLDTRSFAPACWGIFLRAKCLDKHRRVASALGASLRANTTPTFTALAGATPLRPC